MSDLIIISLCLWMLLGLFGSIIEIAVIAETWRTGAVSSPRVIYENTRLNWFGCWFLFILLRLFNIWATLVGLVAQSYCFIVAFIKWLFTVGREDD